MWVCICVYLALLFFILNFISCITICIIHLLLIYLLSVSLPLDSKLHQDRDFDDLTAQYLPSA